MTEENDFGTPISFEDAPQDDSVVGGDIADLADVDAGTGPETVEEAELLNDLFLSPDSEPSEAASTGAHVARLAELEAERDDYKNRLMRTAADLENFRKRAAREREDMRKYGIDRMIMEILPALDNLERALEHAEKNESSANITEGVRMVARQFLGALEKHGVNQFDARGEMFDPQRHEAIQQLETAEFETGRIVEQYQRGYFLHDRLLRPALVAVAKRVEVVDDGGIVEAASSEASEETSDDSVN